MNLFSRKLLTTSHNVMTLFYITAAKDHDLDLWAPYQREYVWKEKEQQEFLYSLFNHLPLGTIAIALTGEFDSESEFYYEVVDGKQRITTLLLFRNSKVPYIVGGVKYFWKDLTEVEKRQFNTRGMPYQELYNGVDEKSKLEYFYRVNFTGVPQSEEHRQKIIDMMESE